MWRDKKTSGVVPPLEVELDFLARNAQSRETRRHAELRLQRLRMQRLPLIEVQEISLQKAESLCPYVGLRFAAAQLVSAC